MKAKVGLCWGIVCAMMAWGAMAAERADFTTGEGTNGWTISAAGYVSPTYASAVDRISLSYSGSAAGAATVSAITNGGGEAQVATLSAAANAATFDFPETTDFRAFRISTTGDWRLFSFAADVSAAFLAVPSNVVATALTTDSLEASWDPVADATGYRVSICTNRIVGASEGTEVWTETMPGATNAASPTKLTDAKFANCFERSGWTRSDKAGYPTGENGTIRIGTASDKGWIQTPEISHVADLMAVRFFAKANATNTKSMDMEVERVSGSTSTLVGVATLTTEFQEFTIALPGWERGDCIRFNSLASGDMRTIIGAVALVSGYSEGVPTPDVFREISVDAATSCTIENLPTSEPVFVRVTATGTRGLASEASADVAVDLAHPPPRAILNAFPLSELEEGCYAQNFDSLAAMTSTSGDKEWLNGTTLPYWQAYKKKAAVSTFKHNAGAATSGGLYALATNQSHSVRALGGYSTQSDEICFGIAFTNDTDATMRLSSVSYSAQQWGFKNTANQTLSVSAALAKNLVWIADYDGEWAEISSAQSNIYGSEDAHDTPSILTVTPTEALPLSVGPNQILMLKWTIHSLKSGTLGMMAIDDLAVTFTNDSRSLVIHLVGRGK